MSLMDLGKRLLDAAKRGDTDEVRLLMSNGAPFTTDWLGTSPLHFASQNGHMETAEVLLRAGISRDARTKVDRTPLHVASQYGHEDIVDLLIQNNADVEAKDMLKMTPLHWSVEKGHYSVIQCLLKHGADLNCLNKFDKTALEIAICNSRADIAQLIQSIQVSRSPITETEVITEEMHVIQPDNEQEQAATEITAIDSSDVCYDTVTVRSTDYEAVPEAPNMQSTSVLATLAALAEATAPAPLDQTMSTSTSTLTAPPVVSTISTCTSTATSDALNLLVEAQGMTMISDADNTTLVTAIDGGQTLSLTEAGKLALKEAEAEAESSSDVSTAQQVIAIVSNAGELQQVQAVVTVEPAMETQESSNGKKEEDEKKEIVSSDCEGESDILSNWLQGKQSFESLDQGQLKKHLDSLNKGPTKSTE